MSWFCACKHIVILSAHFTECTYVIDYDFCNHYFYGNLILCVKKIKCLCKVNGFNTRVLVVVLINLKKNMNNRLTLRGQFLWKKWQEMKLEKKKSKLLGFGKVPLRNWMGTNRSHKPTCKVHSKFFVISFIPINPLTPTSDQDRISPYSINTILTR